MQLKQKLFPPKNVFSPLNLKTWLRVRGTGQRICVRALVSGTHPHMLEPGHMESCVMNAAWVALYWQHPMLTFSCIRPFMPSTRLDRLQVPD